MKKKKYDKDWLESQYKKDENELNLYKMEIINSIKKLNKEEIFQKNKVSIWTRIKRTLGF
jgi:hypothetical protein